MNKIEMQIKELAPSAKEPLFRRLMVDESVSYLREKNGIYGFEVETTDEQALSGFAVIGIQKHTIYAFCSDLDEKPRLILFPPIEKLFDPAFELLTLNTTKRFITDASFTGTKVVSGQLKDLVKDLTPPVKQIDVSSEVLAQMSQRIKDINEGREEVKVAAKEPERKPAPVMKEESPVVDEPQVMDEPQFVDESPMMDDFNEGYDDYSGFEEGGDFDDYGPDEDYELEEDTPPEPVAPPEPVEDERSTKLKAQTFQSLSEVSDYCVREFKIQKPLATTLVNKALQSNVDPEYRIDLAVKLFCKLFDTHKL